MKGLLLCGLAFALISPAAAAGAPLVPRELASLVRYPDTLVQLSDVRRAHAESRLRAAGGEVVSRRLGVWRLPSRAAQRLVPALALDGALTEFEPDYPRTAANHGNGGDPLLSLEWWLGRVGADRVDAPGPGKPVTVVDSGIDVAHPEFAGRPDTTLLNPQSLRGRNEFHGTAVSSVLGAPANGVGVVGVYPQAVIASWDASPTGQLTASDVIAGIAAGAARGAGVINLSLGGPDRSTVEATAVRDAFARGSILVAAVGNEREDGSPVNFPANLPHVVTVGSTSSLDTVSSFSNASPALDVAAPGESIPVAVPAAFAPSGFATAGGTSFSAPIVAGAIAWIWTVRPELDKTQVIELVRRTARDLAPAGRDNDTGFGLLDIPAALAAPAPRADPAEPNDAIDQIAPGSLAPKPSLTTPARGRASLEARIDAVDDPRDVYRFFVPSGRQVTATLRSNRGVELRPLGTRPARTTVRIAGTGGTRTLIAANQAARGVYVYLNALLRTGGTFPDASYTLTLTTARAAAR